MIMKNRKILIVLLMCFMLSCNGQNGNKTISNDFPQAETPNNETINIQQSSPNIWSISEKMLRQEKLTKRDYDCICDYLFDI
jgi:hypothetical protein